MYVGWGRLCVHEGGESFGNMRGREGRVCMRGGEGCVWLLFECLQQECTKLMDINEHKYHVLLQHELQSERMHQSV